MSRTTPQIVNGFLKEYQTDAIIAVNSPEWFMWLGDKAHHTFHFNHPTGGFTARKERKQRGDCYWVGYHQLHNKLHKIYLGKSETLTQAYLCDASSALAEAITLFEQEHHQR